MTNTTTSKTPLTDSLSPVETFDMDAEPYLADNFVMRSDCRAIEERLNRCVEALEWVQGWFPEATQIYKRLEEAIAEARKPLHDRDTTD